MITVQSSKPPMLRFYHPTLVDVCNTIAKLRTLNRLSRFGAAITEMLMTNPLLQKFVTLVDTFEH